MMNPVVPGVLEVLLVEDNVGDVALFQEATLEAGISVSVHTAGNGIEALGYLSRSTMDPTVCVPDVIVCDINMPRMNGIELLRRLQCDVLWQGIPVIMLTSASLPTTKQTCHDLGAKAYWVKPNAFDGLVALCKHLPASMAA